MYDFHIHSNYSMDCKYPMNDMAIKAIDNNLKSICFTDHIDLDITENKIDLLFHTDDYFEKIKKIKYKYIKKLKVLSGVEIGLQPHLAQRYNQLINNNPFDFVIASVHTVGGIEILSDTYLNNKKPLDTIIDYYKEMYECIDNFNNYDVLGHIDLIDRYLPKEQKLPEINDYKWIIEKILTKIIEQGKGIELNTSGLRYGLEYFHPKIEILNLYKQLGGEIITIGSDAHIPSNVGYMYKEAEKLLRELNFKYIFIYKERKKIPIHIS